MTERPKPSRLASFSDTFSENLLEAFERNRVDFDRHQFSSIWKASERWNPVVCC